MAKTSIKTADLLASLDVGQLERLLSAKRAIESLEAEREKLQEKLAAVDAKIAALTSGASKPAAARAARKKAAGRKAAVAGPRRAARKGKKAPLGEIAVGVLAKNEKPMRVGDLADAILKAGYATKSKAFDRVVRILVYKDPRIKKVDRGLFTVESAGAAPPKTAKKKATKKTSKKASSKTSKKASKKSTKKTAKKKS